MRHRVEFEKEEEERGCKAEPVQEHNHVGALGEDLSSKWHQKTQKEYGKLPKKHPPAQGELRADDASQHVAVVDVCLVVVLPNYEVNQAGELQFIDGLILDRILTSP